MQKGKRGRAKAYNSDSLMFRSVLGILLIALGILSVISIVGGIQGAAFAQIKQAMQGLGGNLCLGVPLFFIWSGVLIAFSARKKAPVRAFLFILMLYLCVLGIITLLSGIGQTQLIAYAAGYNQSLTPPVPDASGYWAIIKAGYLLCSGNGYFGGALGMITAWPLWTYVGVTGGVVILGVLSLICVLFFSKFDVLGTVRQMREKAVNSKEQREIDRKAKAFLKEIKVEPVAEEAGPNDLLRPAYLRQMEKQGNGMQPPERLLQNPLEQAPEFKGAYPSINTYMQAVPAVAAAPLPLQTQMFGGQATPIQMYDEMIVPEMPDGSTVSDWKLKPAKGQRQRSVNNPENMKQAPVLPLATDRESSKVVGRMESILNRKDQIEQQLNASEGKASLQYGNTFAPNLKRADADAADNGKKQRRSHNAQDFAPQPAQFGNAQPGNAASPYPDTGTQTPMTAAQMEYARQTAAYQPPSAEARPKTAQAGATGAPADRFSAYRRPSGEQTNDQTNELLHEKKNRQEIGTRGANGDTAPVKAKAAYPYPMIELLNLRTQSIPDTREQDRANALKLERTLESFGIPAQVQRVTHGPAVTRFELGLVSSGINVKRIMNIADNIALDMAANGGVRIEVPIPGTNLFGVEIPNKEIISVSLAEVLTSPEMTAAKSPLSVALGKDIAGRPIICDLAKMPHLLIAGQTGSGKSVCINAIINSLLFRTTPEEVRMIMIDPKVVELQGYNKVPHLLIPVVSDPHKASGALAWAVQEMLDRYHKMQSKGVREISSYNAKVIGDEPKLPRIVIIIDELSDLMLACKKEVEESIIRLAQLARAAGIHVVVATQRPTVNVITGLIKANIPSRIAFAVASSVDSRTILDMNGAEKLLGKGDMFYYPTGEKAPLRVQGCFLSDAEITGVVDYIGKNSETDYDEHISEIMESPEPEDADSANADDEGSADERLQEAVEMVLTDGQASISMLQRRMKIGYARAGRLIDDMAARGIVSKSAGSKPREILMSYEQYLKQQDTLLR